ncbi:MAG: chromosomal replication initiator protein DnaA [Chloroflexi bacterium]|nr:chromosomal replication initiator protein DnaA [Chloroflexota bacterium]
MAVNTRQLWQSTLSELQIQMRPEDFRTWFRNTDLLSFDGGRCVVGVENPFSLDWLSIKCAGLVSRTLEALVGKPVDVQFVVGRSEQTPPETTPLTLSPPSGRPPRRASGRRARLADDLPALSPRYTFDAFVVGYNNRLAHAACVAVAERPGQAHNPLFIYGGVGLGKTHLLHAIAHSVVARGLEVVYVSSETFTNEFIESISRGRMEEFRAKYRGTQVLLIDDIQFLAGKEQTQEEFFHTFNAIHEASGQIVMTSDRHPKAITTLEDRLRSRFVWGLMTDVQPPDLETRTAILRAKIASAARRGEGVSVPSDVVDYIAAKVPNNIRELEGALNRVLAYADLVRLPVTLDLAATALQELLQPAQHRTASPEGIVKAVCRATGVPRHDLEGKQRDRRVVVPRQIAMHLLREETDLSLSEIGALFGGRDHSTVLHSCEKISADVERNDRVRSIVRGVRELLVHSGS